MNHLNVYIYVCYHGIFFCRDVIIGFLIFYKNFRRGDFDLDFTASPLSQYTGIDVVVPLHIVSDI